MKKFFFWILPILIFSLTPQQVFAHAFGAVYTLPIPFWLYLFTAASALLLSFLLIAFFITDTRHAVSVKKIYLPSSLAIFFTSKTAVIFYKMISIFLFLMTILSGFIGEDLSAYNFSMTFFWVIFFLGFTYLTFFLSNIWETISPWKVLVELFETVSQSKWTAKVQYPKILGYLPALLFYFFFIVLELVIGTTPFSLGIFLLQYTFITLFGVFLFGKELWFKYGEFFSVLFRFISYCSPITKEKDRILLHLPFTQLLHKKAEDFSSLLFVLFMLSSTAFDGFRETNMWVEFYWNMVHSSRTVFGWISFQLIDVIGIFLSPFFFLLLYVFVIILMKLLTKTKKSVKELALTFAFSLIPIALAYNIAHYFTLFLVQGQEIIRLISDPFGWGWNIFGTATFSANLGILRADFVWHMQVVLILTGHIASVIIGHYIAVQTFMNKKQAFISQFPMLLLMILYTVIGLWILSQPIAA